MKRLIEFVKAIEGILHWAVLLAAIILAFWSHGSQTDLNEWVIKYIAGG